MVYLYITLQIFKSASQHLHISLSPHIIVFKQVQPLNGQHLVLVVQHALVEFVFYHLLLLLVNLLVLLSDLFFKLFLFSLKLELFF